MINIEYFHLYQFYSKNSPFRISRLSVCQNTYYSRDNMYRPQKFLENL